MILSALIASLLSCTLIQNANARAGAPVTGQVEGELAKKAKTDPGSTLNPCASVAREQSESMSEGRHDKQRRRHHKRTNQCR